ncbi:dUTP diphosphatase [Clathrospora elynae]|uniref:Deoxyuridine 5'-triphosphate nucleotidohydrolase n=1 Tax=Clathrospora elynae TaxID=706981 RepID=A0A6A5S9J5_9PLEO|nr:dUTP diphosphatase [Clathrospora elynae]
MAEERATPLPMHEPPSLPNSPLPKRTKVIDPTPLSHADILPRGDDISGTATPTPLANIYNPDISNMTNMSALQPEAPAAAQQQLQVQLLSTNARAPTKGSLYAAGHDLYSAKDVIIPARGRALVATEISISVPVGTYGRVAPRSGLAFKHGIDTLAGVIDADYRGAVGVILANFSDDDYAVKAGDRIAQLIVEKIVMPTVVVVDQLDASVRGAGGFGSTGTGSAAVPAARPSAGAGAGPAATMDGA